MVGIWTAISKSTDAASSSSFLQGSQVFELLDKDVKNDSVDVVTFFDIRFQLIAFCILEAAITSASSQRLSMLAFDSAKTESKCFVESKRV